MQHDGLRHAWPSRTTLCLLVFANDAGETDQSGHTRQQRWTRTQKDLFFVNARRFAVELHGVFSNHLPGPAHWPMRKMTNSAGRTIATPTSITTQPSSRWSGASVSASHLT